MLEHLIVLVEEPSLEAALAVLLPKILGKKAAAHAIAVHMEPARNRSGSFQAFYTGLRAATGGSCP